MLSNAARRFTMKSWTKSSSRLHEPLILLQMWVPLWLQELAQLPMRQR